MVKITEAEHNKEYKVMSSFRDVWHNIKHPQHLNYRSLREEDKRKGHEKIFEGIIVKIFLNMGKEIATQVQEAQRVPYRINSRRNTSRHILIKLTKIKHKEQTLKAAREKQQIRFKRISIRLTTDLSTEILQARRE